ncbi:MAG: helix-turn-helix transcriptional regulator [Steroidobacteraceae bacterium]|jgi:transcriptional regulator with XRE-family HTH domain
MSDHTIDLETLGERLAGVRRTYGESIDLPNLGSDAFATLLGVPATAYASCERGEREPTVDLLVALRNRTRISLDWFLDPNQPGANRPSQ